MIEYRGYTGTFKYDPELELLAGHVIDLRDEIYFEGQSVAELKSSMHRAVDITSRFAMSVVSPPTNRILDS